MFLKKIPKFNFNCYSHVKLFVDLRNNLDFVLYALSNVYWIKNSYDYKKLYFSPKPALYYCEELKRICSHHSKKFSFNNIILKKINKEKKYQLLDKHI